MKIRSVGKVKAGFPAIVKKQQAEFKARRFYQSLILFKDKSFRKKYGEFEGGIAKAEAKNKKIEEVGESEGLSGKQLERFRLFITGRFPKEEDYSYIRTWARRFSSGRPEDYCDDLSLKELKRVDNILGTKSRGW